MKSALIKIPEEIKRLISQHLNDLEEAWATKEADESLIISFSAKIGIDKKGKNICEVIISFVKDRIKDGICFEWDDRQLSLLKTIGKMDQDLKEKGHSMTINSPGYKSVTLGIDKKIPCIDCVNDIDQGGVCDRGLYHASIDGKEWECESKKKLEDLPEDNHPFYNQKKKKTKKEDGDESHS